MESAKNPKVHDVDVVLCWHCGEECKKGNLQRHTKRRHGNQESSWKLPNVTPITSFFKVCGHSVSRKDLVFCFYVHI